MANSHIGLYGRTHFLVRLHLQTLQQLLYEHRHLHLFKGASL